MCKGGMGAMQWPDGRALLDQPTKLADAFNVIADIENHYRKKD